MNEHFSHTMCGFVGHTVFRSVPACDGQTDGHRTTAKTVLYAERHAGKKNGSAKSNGTSVRASRTRLSRSLNRVVVSDRDPSGICDFLLVIHDIYSNI